MPRWAILAAPEDKRTRGFCAALAACGEGEPLRLSWPAVAADPHGALAMLAADDIVRIDSPGADESAWAALAACVGGQLVGNHSSGRWQPGRQRFAGLAAVLAVIGDMVAQRGLRVLAHPHDILVMSDKARCREHLIAAGIRVPPALPPCTTYDDLLAAMGSHGWTSVFIKPRWGSSGAGIMAFRRAGSAASAREQAITTLSYEREGGDFQLYNTKRLRTISDPSVLHGMINQVLADGAVVERWIPKLAVEGGPVDLRVVAIAGRLRHRIARVGRGPITNLHLDARRLDADQLIEQASPARRSTILATATAVAHAFPRSWYLGMDLLVTHEFRECLVGEVNAWGDLLPGLEHEGEDTFTAEIRSLLSSPQRVSPCTA